MRALLLAFLVAYAGVAGAKTGGSAIGVSVPSTTCEGYLISDSGERISAFLSTIEKSPSMTVIFRGDRFAAEGYFRLLPNFTGLGKEKVETKWIDDSTRYRLTLTWKAKEVPTALRVRYRGEEDLFLGNLICR